MSNEKKCWVCLSTRDLHKHHVFGGMGRRRVSEREGCWVYLCRYHHNGSNYSVHHSSNMDKWLKALCQQAWENEHNGDRELFIKTFGKSYILDGPDKTSEPE